MTLLSDCPVQIFREMMKYLKIYLTSFTVFMEILKKKKSSENDQSTGHFQSFLIYFFGPHDPRSEKNPVNQLIKKPGLIDATCAVIKLAYMHYPITSLFLPLI